jgi:hypothetical protein
MFKWTLDSLWKSFLETIKEKNCNFLTKLIEQLYFCCKPGSGSESGFTKLQCTAKKGNGPAIRLVKKKMTVHVPHPPPPPRMVSELKNSVTNANIGQGQFKDT